MVGTPCFHCHGLGSIPGRGTEILQGAWYGQKIKAVEKKKKREREMEVTSSRTEDGEQLALGSPENEIITKRLAPGSGPRDVGGS